MAYTKQTWADLPSKTTPINASRLEHIEDGIYDAAQTADTAASTAGTASANVGIVSSKVETLTERVNGLDTAVSNKVDKVAGKGLSTNDYDNTDKGKVDSLGTASTKNSTSVVTESSDLVESGAVKDIVGWGNKNLLDPNTLGLYDATGTSTYRYGFKPIALKAGTYTFSYGALAENVSAYITNITNNYAQLPVPTDTQALTFTLNVESIIFVRTSASQATTITNAQLEKGSTATAYEPYHASVEETIPQVVSDAVGWGNKNKLPYFTEIKSISGVTVTPSNGRYSFTGTASGAAAIQYPVTVPINSGVYRFIADGYGYIANSNISLYYDDNGTTKSLAPNETIDLSLYTILAIAFFAGANVTVNYQNIGLMLVKESEPDKSFEPYHASVSDSLAEKADNSVIGTVEDGTNPTKAYAVGEHMTRGGKFCTVSSPVTTSSTWTLGSNYVEGTIADELNILTNPFYPFREYSGSATSLESLPHGLWMLTATQMNNVSDKPSEYSAGRAYALRTGSSDDNVLIVMNAQSKKIWVKFQYATWSTWFTISMS